MAEPPHPLKCVSMHMGECTCSRIGVYCMDMHVCAQVCACVPCIHM